MKTLTKETVQDIMVFILCLLFSFFVVATATGQQLKVRPMQLQETTEPDRLIRINTGSSMYVINHVFNGVSIEFTASMNGMVVYSESSLELLITTVLGSSVYTVTYRKSCVCEPCCDSPYMTYTQTGSNLIIPQGAYNIVYSN